MPKTTREILEMCGLHLFGKDSPYPLRKKIWFSQPEIDEIQKELNKELSSNAWAIERVTTVFAKYRK